MTFTKRGYGQLLELLRQHGYEFCGYHNLPAQRCVILRHDVDTDLNKALELAELEAAKNIHSTYFVLLRTEFYNPASQQSQQVLQRIHDLGHEIGLHFDEVFYGESDSEATVRHILTEADILSMLCGFPVTTVSMHRPSKATLEADLHIPGMVNAYSAEFFRDFKYLSDSRRHWREPVEDIICSEEYDRLHILTHAFWYQEQEESMTDTVKRFVRAGRQARYDHMAENITNFRDILKEEDV